MTIRMLTVVAVIACFGCGDADDKRNVKNAAAGNTREHFEELPTNKILVDATVKCIPDLKLYPSIEDRLTFALLGYSNVHHRLLMHDSTRLIQLAGDEMARQELRLVVCDLLLRSAADYYGNRGSRTLDPASTSPSELMSPSISTERFLRMHFANELQTLVDVQMKKAHVLRGD